MFREIAASFKVFPQFLDVLFAFGFKLRAEDENFGCYHSRVHRSNDINGNDGHFKFEFTYNLRYPDKHGRDLNDPWSIRNMAVYQQFNSVTTSSSWIILQPSKACYRLLRDFSNGSEYSQARISGLPLVNMLYFWSIEKNWRDYINYLEKELLILEKKAFLSRVGQKKKADFAVAFIDCQDVQQLRKKMRKCDAILKATLEVADGYEGLFRDLAKASLANTDDFELSYFLTYKSRIRSHLRGVAGLLQSSADILQMLFHILEYRNDEVLIRSSDALEKNSEGMRAIAAAASEENKSIVFLTAKSQRDSRMVKIVTVIAMAYLPASLVASILSTDLIQFGSVENDRSTRSQSQSQSQYRVRLAREFWVFPIFSIALLVMTFSIAFGWAQWERLRFRLKGREHTSALA
ncbi:hypothetical protein B0O99DRAFT_601212 [Bisporella sp. PMI_857]|nr:hypothetical protein B0O99DRAFT_601212 [Bisporella sp. PMI_857]